MNEFLHSLRVYIEDTDAGGIVYYVNYLKYFERCRTELFRSLGFGKAAILEEGRLLVVKKIDVDYLMPARLDDELVASARIEKIANTYVIFHQAIDRDGQCLCRGSVKIACVSQVGKTIKPTALPKPVQTALSVYQAKSLKG